MAIKLEVSDQIKRKKPVTEANKGYSATVYKALDDTYVSEWDGKVDPDFIADNVELFIWNTEEYYNEIFNTRRPAHSVAYSGLLGLFQLNVTDSDVNVRITSEMVKQWLKKHGLDYVKLLKPVVDKIEEERAERKAEKRESVRSKRSVKEEVFPYELKRDSSFPYMYVLTHGFGPGTLPRGVKVGRVEDYKGYTVVWLDRPLSTDELKQYDIPSETYLRRYLGNDLDYFRGLSGLPEGINRKRTAKPISERSGRIGAKRSMRESAWTAPNGKKYGKQKRSHGSSRYIFTRRELKDMVDSGIAQEIRDAEEAWKMSKDVIGYSWNETNGFKSGILFTDKDGNLWVGNTGVAQMFL